MTPLLSCCGPHSLAVKHKVYLCAGLLDGSNYGVWTSKFGLDVFNLPVMLVLEENQQAFYLNRTASARFHRERGPDQPWEVSDQPV